MGLYRIIQRHTNSLRFFKILKNKKNNTELVDLALKERGILYKIIQNIAPELIETKNENQIVLNKKEVIQIIEKSLNIIFFEKFKSLSDAVFCASIGQVHRAILKDNTLVAIKIQYPNVKASIDSQLNLLKIAAKGAKLTKISKWNIDTDSHITTIEKKLHEELDYNFEINNLIYFNSKNPKNRLHPFLEYSNSSILTQSWIEGLDFYYIKKNWTEIKRKEVADLLVQEYFKHFFIDGFCQGDNNISNFIVTEAPPKVHWIDFGNWIRTSEDVRYALFYLIYKTIKKEQMNYVGHFEIIGFDLKKIKYFQNLLPCLVDILFDPFLENRPFDSTNWKMEERIENLLGKNKWWFRSSGQSDFLELMKSFYGIFQLVKSLNININWHSHFLQLATQMDFNKIETKIPFYENQIPQSHELAKHLLIQIIKNSTEHARIELPAGTFLDLENLISEDIHDKLKERGINISEIKFKYLEKGLVPGKVFELEDTNSAFYIYLT